jgi:hypothetical protein
MQPDATTRLTTAGGTLLVLIQIRNEEILKAMVLAGVGALVSFSVSLLLKWLFRKIIKRINKNKK